jgi:hypothetical protein
VLIAATAAGVVSVRQSQLDRALIAAVKRGDDREVAALIAGGAHGDARDTSSLWFRLQLKLRNDPVMLPYPTALNVLMYEVLAQSVPTEPAARITQMLLDHGADVEAAYRDRDTLLQVAAQAGNEPIARILLDHGANANGRNAYGATPLMWAAAGSKDEVLVRLLVQRGAQLNAQDDYGSTPLRFAAVFSSNNATTRALLSLGANPKLADNSGYTPLQAARDRGSSALITTLSLYLAGKRMDEVSIQPANAPPPRDPIP